MSTDLRLALICEHVFRDERPVRLVIHHRDGHWQMMCGETDHDEEAKGCEVAHVSHMMDRQPELRQFDALKPGELADWVDGQWLVGYHDD